MGEEGKKLQWMYEGKNSEMDREAYLLGKRITKPTGEQGDFIVKDESEKKFEADVLQRLDYESKMREDPLERIRKTEEERRRELLSNPVKVKKIKSNLMNALKGDLQKSRKAKRHQHSSSEDSDSYHRGSRHKQKRSSKSLISQAQTSDKVRNSLKMALQSQLAAMSSSSDSSSSSESSSDERHKKKKKSKKSEKKSRHRNRSRSNSPIANQKKAPHREGYGLQLKKSRLDEDHESSYKKVDLSKAKKKSDVIANVRSNPQGFTKKLSSSDLEKKRQEMMANADWRNQSRKANVKRYAQEEKLEKTREDKLRELSQKHRTKYGKEKSFLHDLKVSHTSSGSLEDTVRRKKHTLSKKTDYTM